MSKLKRHPGREAKRERYANRRDKGQLTQRERNRERQQAQEQTNNTRRLEGLPTPWQMAKSNRLTRRVTARLAKAPR
jgi:hypothetical protein